MDWPNCISNLLDSLQSLGDRPQPCTSRLYQFEGPRLRLDALLAGGVREVALDAPVARTCLSQRLRPRRVLHDRDVVEEVVFSGTKACVDSTHQLYVGQLVGRWLRHAVGGRLGG